MSIMDKIALIAHPLRQAQSKDEKTPQGPALDFSRTASPEALPII